MVRPRAPRAHSSLHAEPAAGGNRAGQPGGFHAVPLPLAARRERSADRRRRPARGVAALDGFELAGRRVGTRGAAGAPRRYEPSMLDMICLAGEAGWGRLSPPRPTREPGALVAGDADRAVPARARRCVADAAPARRGRPEAQLADKRHAAARVLRSRGASFFGDVRGACGLDADDSCCGHRHAGRLRPRDLRRLRRPARAAGECARRARQFAIAARPSPAAGAPSRPRRGRDIARRRGRDPGLGAAPPLWRRLSSAADARNHRRAVARAGAGLPPPRGARRNPQRPLRHGHVGRAVRAAAGDRAAPRGPAIAADGAPHRSAPPIR